MKALMVTALIGTYPAESVAAVIPKPMQGFMLIALYFIIFIALIFFMLRCAKKKRKH